MQEYNKTDQQLHFLSQLVAKANRTYVSKKEDDSHTNLFFDALGNRITGRWIETKNNKVLFVLNLDTLTIEVINESGNSVAEIATISNHLEEVEQEVEKVLPSLGLDPNGFTEPLHYEIPQYDFAKNPIAKIDQNDLAHWIHFRKLANQACFQLLGYTQLWEEVRIWPHHFDTGIYTVPKNNLGIGFGLAMEDSMAGSPYFYLAGYPLKGEIIYTNLPQSDDWEWETDDNWKGVILTLDTLCNLNEAAQLSTLTRYITKNIKWLLDYEN